MRAHNRQLSRRQEYAEATRQAIIAAARKLFAERGYFATRVEDIARQARVAPATVYAVTGGKSGLLAELIRIWTTDPIVEATLSSVSSARSGAAIIAEVAAASRRMREDFADIMRVLLTTAPHDQAVMQELQQATAVYRAAFQPVADRLAQLGALRAGLDVRHAADVLWFYFGYASYFTLHDDDGWSYERAERWLAEQATRELLGPARRPRSSSADHRGVRA